jgi:hypothetical protein
MIALLGFMVSACAGNNSSYLPLRSGSPNTNLRDLAVAGATPAPGMCSLYAAFGTLNFCYDMDDTAGTVLHDSSAAAHNGTISPTGVAYRAAGLTSNSTAAETTDGVTGALKSGISPVAASFSLSFFVSLHSNAGNYGSLAATGQPFNGAGNGKGWNIFANVDGNNTVWATIGTGAAFTALGGIALPLNTATNVTLAYNNTTKVATLCLGTTATPKCSSATLPAAYVPSAKPITFGGGGFAPANATFDEAGFWPGVVLTAVQSGKIAAYSGAGVSPTPTPTPSPSPTPTSGPPANGMCTTFGGFGTLSNCFDMDETGGTTLIDASGKHLNGTISATGISFGVAGLAAGSKSAETTDGVSGALTSGAVPAAGSFSTSFFVALRSNLANYGHLAATSDPNGPSATGWDIFVNTDANNTLFAMVGYGTGYTALMGPALPLNTATNITLVYNSVTKAVMLCAGTTATPACTTATLPAAYVASGNPITFGGGARYAPANATFDEAAFFGGTALTPTQISTTAADTGTGSASPSPSPAPSVTFNDYTTFGYDNQRDAFNPNSSAITDASIANLHLGWQASLGDYNTQGQPVLATEIPGHAGVLFLGGGTGNVYAYDALTGALLWTKALGQETFSCEGGQTIYFGVGGSAAYDPGSKSLYIVGNKNSAVNANATNSLVRLDGATGTILGQTNIAPNPLGPSELDFSHTSVTLGSNGLAYVGTSATCDISSWRGRVAAVNVPAMTLANTFFTVWNSTTQPWGGGGIWGWGGVSLDASGNVFTGVGNTDNGATTHGSIVAPFVAAPEEYSGLGDAFIKVSSDLSTLEDSNHPIPVANFVPPSVDLDVQGTPAIFQPSGVACDPLAAVQGKSGELTIYDTTKVGSGPLMQYPLAPSTYADGFLGGPAYSPATGLLYAAVTSSGGSLYPPGMIAISPGCGSPSVLWHTAFGPDSYPDGVPRSVPAASAGGVVFVGTPCTSDGNGGCTGTTDVVAHRASAALVRPKICCAPPGSGRGALWALDATSGAVLNNGLPLVLTNAPLRAPPTIDGNWIYVIDMSGNMYGLTIDPSVPAAQTRTRAVDPHVMKRWEAEPRAPRPLR